MTLLHSKITMSLTSLLLLCGLVFPYSFAQKAPISGQVATQTMQGQAELAPQQEHVLIILDASFSMTEPLNDGTKESKMSVAKRAILQVLNAVPQHVNIGLRVYGADTSNRMFACRDTRLIVPIASNQRYRISSALLDIHPTGATPISYSIQQAVEQDFRGLTGKKSVILVSDGMETCGQDPCRVAVGIQRNNIDVKINVVGFGLQDVAAANQLKCIALSTFGEFHRADTAAQLANQLGNTIEAQTAVQGRVILPPRQPSPPTVTKPALKPPIKETEYRL